MAIDRERLSEIVHELLTRPGHEKVRSLLYVLLVDGVGVRSSEIDYEKALPEVHGRADALVGRTVLEFKSDLRRERDSAEEELTRYLSQREAETRERYVGIATDGAEFRTYELRGKGLQELLDPYVPTRDDPRALLVWLQATVAAGQDLRPEPHAVEQELGKYSPAYRRARLRLADLWREVRGHPDVILKRQLWAQLLERVYGTPVEEQDELFFQHTYLTIVAKAMAALAMGVETKEWGVLLSGERFRDAGIEGAVESDFFDWVLEAGGANDLVSRIVGQVARFRLAEIENDVLKVLYESLIDPEQRHDLGEYYTPDWLAKRMCEHVIDDPLEQRVLDPACGSGTFLFHAVRRLLAAAKEAGLSNRKALERCCAKVIGIDVHPVAVLIARVTYLLAIGEQRLTARGRPPISIPVYLGDSLQWNTYGMMVELGVEINVPDGPVLHFPGSVAVNPGMFDQVISRMLELSKRKAGENALDGWLAREVGAVVEQDRRVLLKTYAHLSNLRAAGRNHIWGYVARNLVRPVWLSSSEQRPDVVIGNPPWLSYRYMSRENQAKFKEECEKRDIWAGGKVATHQDLSGYFYARCAELYLRGGGKIALLMPYAALNRKQFEKFLRGFYGGDVRRGGRVLATVRFTEAWTFDESVQPLFLVPSCALFATRAEAGRLPRTVHAASGQLPRRDATLEEAEQALSWREAPWPQAGQLEGGSTYRERFRQGATMVPRMLCVVEESVVGRLGSSPDAPAIESRRTSQEKPPWKTLPTLRGNVETRFVRRLYLGESIAPYRLFDPALAVVPWEGGDLLDAKEADERGYLGLADWLARAEKLWRKRGRSAMSLIERWDYHHEMQAQFPIAPIRVVYSKAGTQPAASVLEDRQAVVDHKLYWAAALEGEAEYLCAILNSETARSRIAHMQSRGQWGARDFDKLMFELPIPQFRKGDPLHKELATAANRAEQVAAAVVLPEKCHFVRARRLIREALREDGVAEEIDRLVERLLG